MTDTSREAVEMRAQQHDGTSAIVPGLLRAWYRETADLLRALVDERDRLRDAMQRIAYDYRVGDEAINLDDTPSAIARAVLAKPKGETP
jgi:hypothetical protein